MDRVRVRNSRPTLRPAVPRAVRAMLPLGVGLALVAASGCTGAGPLDAVADEIDANRALWRSVRPATYQYRLENQCFCGEGIRGPVDILVIADSVVARHYPGSGEGVTHPTAQWFPSVDGLFDFLEDAVDGGAHSVEVTWDAATGLPLEAFVDYDERSVDEEHGFRIVETPAPR